MFSTFAVISTLIASLASTSPKPATHAAKPHKPDPMVVVVQNPRNEPVVVYMESGWAQYRIGVVGARSDTLLTVPSSLFGTSYNNSEVRFYVHAHGANEDATEYIEAAPGKQIGLVVTRH